MKRQTPSKPGPEHRHRPLVHLLLNYLTTVQTDSSPQARVSRITVGRLHNLGNFEHVRYEIAVDIPEGVAPSQALANVERVLAGLDPKPPVSPYDVERAKLALKKVDEEGEEALQEWERSNIPTYRNYVACDEKWRAERQLAREAFDDIGGTRVYTDAKDQWDDRY
jgi:hypothetical protein